MSFETKFGAVRRAGLVSVSALALLSGVAAHGADVTGRVKSEQSSTALEGAVIKIEELNQRATTASDGTFRFRNVAPGDYTVIISYVGAEPLMQKVTVSANGEPLEFSIAGNADDIEEIFVLGQRGSLNSSISKQRAADNVSNFLSSDAAGNFPDQNISEAVRRIVGLSVENDQGEGRYVVIRGLDPNLSSSSVGGVRLPSPEGGDRKVALDVIPSELLSTIEVTKSLTPDMDGDAIGGNVDIKTLSGFDHDELFVKAKIEGSYNKQQDKISPKGSLTFANQFSDTLAMAGSVSYYDRKFGSENMEVDGGWVNEDDAGNEINTLFPEELELRDYVVERRRIGAALNIDFRPSEDHEFYLRGLYSNFKDSEIRTRMELKFTDGEFDADNTNGNRAFFNGIKVDRDLKDRIETQKIFTFSAGGESHFDAITATYNISYSKSEEGEPDRLDTDFKGKGFNAGVDFSNLLMPSVVFNNAADNTGLNDLGEYELDAFEVSNNMSEDKTLSFKLDLAYDTYWGDNPVMIKWGGKARLRDKERNNRFEAYEAGDVSATLAEFRTDVDYPLSSALGGQTADGSALRSFFNANKSSLEVNSADTTIGSNAEDYVAKEDLWAGYLMGRIDIDNVRIVGGVRYEKTNFSTNSQFVFVGEEIITDPVTGAPVLDADGDPETQDVERIEPISDKRSDGFLLPSLNIRWEAQDDLVFRLAYFRSAVRPNVSDMVGSGEIEFEDEFEDGAIERKIEGKIGNPALKPMTAHNIDATVEWYPSNNAIVSAGVFYKDISNYIVERTLEDVTFNGVTFGEVVRPFNGDKATIKGLELNYQQSLTFLPGFLSGMIVGLNYTYVDSDATVDVGDEIRNITLPKTSKHVGNVVLGYEKGPLSVRAAMSYRDGYIDELNADGFGDRYVTSHKQFDFTASYKVTDNIKVYGEMSNAFDEPFVATFRNGNRDYLMQHEEYGWTANMGVKVQF